MAGHSFRLGVSARLGAATLYYPACAAVLCLQTTVVTMAHGLEFINACVSLNMLAEPCRRMPPLPDTLRCGRCSAFGGWQSRFFTYVRQTLDHPANDEQVHIDGDE